MLDLLATIHDEESLVAASHPLLFDVRLDIAALRGAVNSENRYVRWAAGMTLVGSGLDPIAPDLAVPVLVEAIKQGGPEVRKLAFQRLGNLSEKRGYDEVCAPVIDEDVMAGMHDLVYEVHHGALRAVSSCESLPVPIAAREIAAYRGRDSDFRLLLISNLNRRGPEAKGAANALILALDDENSDIGEEAAQALRSAGVDPELYVPPILEALRTRENKSAGARSVDKLVAVAPAAARWAPDIMELLRNEPSPYMRERLRVALKKIGTLEAESTAASSELKDSAVRNAPVIALFAATAVVLLLLVKSGWGVLLGFLFPALPLTAFVFLERGGWWLLAALTAPVFGLAGAGTGFLLASGESGAKRAVGLAGGWISAGATVVYGFLIVVLYYGLAPLGAG